MLFAGDFVSSFNASTNGVILFENFTSANIQLPTTLSCHIAHVKKSTRPTACRPGNEARGCIRVIMMNL